MLELRDVSAGYGDHAVLRGVNLVVPDDAVVALLGPNGAGKTTLLRVATGLLRPTAGSVHLDGIEVTRWAPHRLAARGVCLVPEGRGIFRTLTVGDNLRLQAPGGDQACVADARAAFPRLAERTDQVAGTMSGGEQQMLALVHAFVSDPSFVLLDEVSMGLAPTIVDEIFNRLGRLARSGAGLLLVEQYVTRALELADYVYILNKGRVVFSGESDEVDEDDVLASYFGIAIE